MKTPDGQEYAADASRHIRAAGSAVGTAIAVALKAIWKVWITTWRLASALDSALWRALKLGLNRLLLGLSHIVRICAAAFRSLLLWLPTRTGRAYCAASGVIFTIALLWIIDELRAVPVAQFGADQPIRAPVDQDDPILARIEGRYVHLSEIEASARASGLLREEENLTPEAAYRRELVEAYVEQRLLARAALQSGLHRAPAVSRRVNAARDRVLAAAFMDDRVREKVTSQTVRELYEAQSDVTRLGDEVRARHILVETEEDALEIVGLLRAGADFGAVARERSNDRATAPLGGEVGWFTRAMMSPSFSQAAFQTRPGQLADPFKTEFGWHVLEVTGRRPTSSTPFDEVSDKIEAFLKLRTIDETLRELSQASQVVYFRPEASETDADENVNDKMSSSGKGTLR